MVESGHIMRGDTIVDATIINAPSSTKNAEKKRDPEMHQTKKGNEWRFGMKCHVGVDAGTGLVHTIEVTPANTHDITVASKLIRSDDEVVYGGSGFVGIQKRPEIKKTNTWILSITVSFADREACRKYPTMQLIGSGLSIIARRLFAVKWNTSSGS